MTDNSRDDHQELGARIQEVHNVTLAFVKALEGMDASPDVIARGLGNFTSWLLVGTAVKYGHEPRAAVERWCLHLMDSAAERQKAMLALGLAEPTTEPTLPFL